MAPNHAPPKTTWRMPSLIPPGWPQLTTRQGIIVAVVVLGSPFVIAAVVAATQLSLAVANGPI